MVVVPPHQVGPAVPVRAPDGGTLPVPLGEPQVDAVQWISRNPRRSRGRRERVVPGGPIVPFDGPRRTIMTRIEVDSSPGSGGEGEE